MVYAWDNDSTQNAHIKHSNDNKIISKKHIWKHIETIRHMRDLSLCRIMGKEYQTMTNREKFAEQILDIACSNAVNAVIAVDKTTLEPIACGKLECKDCLFNVSDAMSCGDNAEKWANSEYVEPPVDWSKVAVDTPILVKDNSDCEWLKRHFAKYENGKVYAWNKGTTSWSGNGCVPWGLAKLSERSEHEAD